MPPTHDVIYLKRCRMWAGFLLCIALDISLAGCGGGVGTDVDLTDIPPSFAQDINAQVVMVGETATFTVQASGSSLSLISGKKMERPLRVRQTQLTPHPQPWPRTMVHSSKSQSAIRWEALPARRPHLPSTPEHPRTWSLSTMMLRGPDSI